MWWQLAGAGARNASHESASTEKRRIEAVLVICLGLQYYLLANNDDALFPSLGLLWGKTDASVVMALGWQQIRNNRKSESMNQP